MFKYDSVHGRFKGTVEAKDGKLWIEGRPITVFAERNPADIKWGSVGADYIIESTVRCLPYCITSFRRLAGISGCLHNDRQVSVTLDPDLNHPD